MIEIHVDYEVSEYRDILKEFVPIAAKKSKTGAWPEKKIKPTPWMSFMIYVLGSTMFLWKVRKVGACIFEINEKGFSRISKLGKKEIKWSEIDNIHVLSYGYLVQISKGFLPLPYRCFDENQLNEFKKIYATKLKYYQSLRSLERAENTHPF